MRDDKVNRCEHYGMTFDVTGAQLRILGEELPPRVKAIITSGKIIKENQKREINLWVALTMAFWSGRYTVKQSPREWRVFEGDTRAAMMADYYPTLIQALLRWERCKGPWPVYAKWTMMGARTKKMREGKREKRIAEKLRNISKVDLVNELGDIYNEAMSEFRAEEI